jgi:teichuronic acid biosynthesis glycosyltransferase TuaG
MEKGLVSIITPMYNAQHFVGQTIDSVLNQTYQYWEMIIVDDGSKDKGADIVKEYVFKDSRIHYYFQNNNGSAAARNNGIRNAKGQYIALLDADDTWDSEFLIKQIRFMEENDAELVCSSHTRIDEKGRECLEPFIVPFKVGYKDLLKTNSISCLTGLYDTKTFGKVYLREDLRSLRDDYVYWLEIIKKVKVVYGNKEILANYRILPSSVTRKKNSLLTPHFMVYYKIEKLGLIRSLYYFANWAVISYLKYRK